MFGFAIVRQSLFESLDMRAQNERLLIAHFIDRAANFISNRLVLRLQVQQLHLLCLHDPKRKIDPP